MPRSSKRASQCSLEEMFYPISERRTSPRFSTVCFDVKVSRGDNVSLFRARNISNAGIMLNTHVALDIGEHVLIGVADQPTMHGTVLWCNERCCGIQFDRTIDCRALLQAGAAQKRDDRRGGALRVATRKLATSYAENGIRAVNVINVSRRGMGLAHDGSLKTDMLLKLIVESGIEREARVRWASDGRAGVRLLQPLTCEEIERVSNAGRRVAPANEQVMAPILENA